MDALAVGVFRVPTRTPRSLRETSRKAESRAWPREFEPRCVESLERLI